MQCSRPILDFAGPSLVAEAGSTDHRTVETVDTGHACYWGHPETIRARSYRSASSNSIGIMRRVKSRALSNSLLSESSCCW